ncbi:MULTISPECIES: hypothetical protein [Pseudoalteromonas]|uniref:EF-hand domain-containing protein n=1 Tax=Pseudoalteromonas amylolytica TaxID=1859457 RepID=A0A1S1MNB5_9GAMM|nr:MULTISPECIES: hypothetical protein [Pseudoalteromonas]MCF6437225.1 hypothetical protein [Pseudoalteromonas sp. MMG022]OHU84329.1 hypothetical protein BFC16_01435 [Pseudoalteromonas sp. JW3]OHU87132.1 hypothetical protein BET10_00505 [Pseudoalteromonas amylolytica]
MQIPTTLSFATVIALFAPLVMAAGLSFHELDVDGNGLITPSEAEISSALIEQFARLDSDQSDDLSPREFARFKQ